MHDMSPKIHLFLFSFGFLSNQTDQLGSKTRKLKKKKIEIYREEKIEPGGSDRR